MRIAYVTAHLPPDFTSGATLLVERLALEAVRRGHEVEVFSGAIRQDLGDGEIRVDPATAERGFTTRWIGTAERVNQDVDGNWDNPLAAAAATDWLREFRPDVVHMHTLQTLGVGVVEAAADAAAATGVRTVVTMHDLWWWCPRLFLVDTRLRACPLVTDVGTCACARNAQWRGERARRLGEALDRVDQILAPSSALRDVIVANGVDPDRVVVDENHVTDEVAASVQRRRDEPMAPASVTSSRDNAPPVRLLYLGGDSALKGADVMRAAARELAADVAVPADGWQVNAYGLRPDPAVPLPSNVRLLDPFDVTDVVAVMSAHDVLVLPSLARESFSIAAREALAAGLAVVTSDCLGPEEVVIDGVNGMVVPTGDAAALAGAMGSLVAEPTLLARLRAGAAGAPVTLRSAAAHMTALLDIYTAASARPAVLDSPGRTVGFVVGLDGEPARFRAHHPREALALAGGVPGPVAHHLDPRLPQIMSVCDTVLVQQAPATRELLSLIERWRSAGVLVVFDADTGAEPDPRVFEACDGVIAASSALADQITAVTGVRPEVAPDAAGLVELQLAELARMAETDNEPAAEPAGTVRVGYVSDAPTGQADVDLITPMLTALLERHHAMELTVAGPFDLSALLTRFGTRVTSLDAPPWRDVAALMHTFDVNLAPEPHASASPDASARSWLGASMVEVATIAAASGAAAELVDAGRTGLLYSTLADRAAALEALVSDRVLRRRLAAAARREVELHHSPHRTARRYLDAFDSIDSMAPQRAPVDRSSPLSTTPSTEDLASVPPLAGYDLGGAVVGDAVAAGAVGADGDRTSGPGVRLVARMRHTGGRVVRRFLRR